MTAATVPPTSLAVLYSVAMLVGLKKHRVNRAGMCSSCNSISSTSKTTSHTEAVQRCAAPCIRHH